MKRVARIVGAGLLWLVVVACLATVIVPHFLDRIYYRGVANGNFDGERFFNPDGDDTARVPGGGNRARFFWRRMTGAGDAPWPVSVPVNAAKPVARVGSAGAPCLPASSSDCQPMRVTWVGHATVLVQAAGLNILTDPIWSDRTGPLGFGPQRVTAPGIVFDDLPPIDLVLISHNHYDHLDLATLKRLWDRDRPMIVTSLGNDSVIGQAGIPSRRLDWDQSLPIRSDVAVTVLRNHHWSSRWFTDRNRALWSSFVVKLPGGNLFFAGDTGFGDGEWPREAAALGPIRLALLPIGAFRFSPGEMGTGSHIGPKDAVRVFDRLGQPFALPIHWGTFKLSAEARETPPEMLRLLMACSGMDATRFAARRVGEPVEVPALGGSPRPLDERRLDRCAKSPEVMALR